MSLRSLIWPVFTLLMGIALGGSLFWGAFGPTVTQQSLEHSAPRETAPPSHPTKEENDEAFGGNLSR